MAKLEGLLQLILYTSFYLPFSQSQLHFRPAERQLTASCGETFTAQKFRIEIAKNRQTTPLECEYRIFPSSDDVCRLRVRFLQFQLASTTPCQDEFLLINYRRLCGSISGEQIVRFFNSSVTIKYRGYKNHPLLLEVEQETCHQSSPPIQQCDVTTSDLATEISSPQYPEPYKVPVTCSYRILPASPEICQANIKFIDFDLPDSVDCLKARLSINGKSFCGFKNNWSIVANLTDSLNMAFSAVSGEVAGNFRISVKQVACEKSAILANSTLENRISYQPLPCPRCCNRVFNAPSFILHNPGILDINKPTEFNCVYQIAPSYPNICRLRFNFIHFWLGREDFYYGCTDSYLEIDGRRFCGCKDGLTIYSHYQGVAKDVLLTMRGPQNRGFIIEVHQEECGNYRGRSIPEEVTTTDPNNDIEVFSNRTVEKVRARFLVPADETRCHEWNLPHIADKFRGLLQSIHDKCPAPDRPSFPPSFPNPPINPLPPVFPPFPNYPQNPILPPNYPQNPIQPPNYPQNPIQPPQFPQNPIQPPLFPQNPIQPPQYPQNPIQPPQYPQNPILPPNFPQNPIQPPHFPQNPIQPPHPPAPPPQLPCPKPPINPPQFPIRPSPPLFPAPPAYPRCQWLTSLNGWFHSPGFPWQYPPNQKCCFRIRQAPGFCSVQVTVLDFDIVWSPKCWKDYLLVDQRTRYCGQSLQSSVVYVPFRNGLASVDFISDGILSGRGFKARFWQLPCRSPYGSRSDESGPTGDDFILNEVAV